MYNSEEIGLKEVLLKIIGGAKFILKRWYFLILFILIGVVCGYLVESNKSVMYQAKTTFILEEGSAGGSTGLNIGGIGNLFGGSTVGATDLFQGESLFQLYKSRSILDYVLLTDLSEEDSTLIIQKLYLINKKLNEKLSDKNRELLDDRNFLINPTKDQLRTRDSILNGAVEIVGSSYFTVGKPNEKASLIEVVVNAEDEVFAKTFNTNLVKKVNDLYMEIKGGKSYENVRILQHKVDSLKRSMVGSISQVAVSTDQIPNINPTRQSSKEVPIKTATINLETSKSLFAELNKNLEMAKLNLSKEAPLIKIIDDARFPLKVIRPQVKKMAIIGSILGLFLIMGILATYYIIRSILKEDKNENK